MALIRFRKLSITSWENLVTKDMNTRYTVFNLDGSIYGEFIGDVAIESDVVRDILDEMARLESVKADTTYVDSQDTALGGRIDDVEANIDETEADILALQTDKVDKTRTILGLDLQDNILLGEFRTALGNATQSVAGLLSPEDKTHYDALVALLETSDGNNVVDTIGEILEIFENYPEGADLVTILQGKVDKVEGKGLSENDLTDALKNEYDMAYAHSQATGNPHGTKYSQLIDKPTTVAQLGVLDIYTKAQVDAMKDRNGWTSQLLGTLTNLQSIPMSVVNEYDEVKLYSRNASGEIDEEGFRPSLLAYGDRVYFHDGATAFVFMEVDLVFQAPAGYTLNVLGVKYTDLKASDTEYDNSGSELEATDVQGAIDEVKAITDTQGDRLDIVEVKSAEHEYRIDSIEEAARKQTSDVVSASDTDIISLGKDVAETTLRPQVDGLLLLDAPQLVTNGDFSDGRIGWTNVSIGTVSSIEDGLKFESSVLIPRWRPSIKKSLVSGNKVYFYVKDFKQSNVGNYEPRFRWGNEVVTSEILFPNDTNINTISAVRDLPTATLIPQFWTFSPMTITHKDVYIIDISTLIANKQYSPLYNTTFDLMSDAQIKAQMDLWVQDGTLPNDIQAVDFNKRVRSVGKNLFDKSKVTLDGNRINESNGLPFPGNILTAGDGYTDYISIKPNTTYIWSGQTSSIYTYAFYDDNYNYINYVTYDQSFTTPLNAKYVRLSLFSDRLNYHQLELGSVATTYEPYRNTDLYIKGDAKGYRVQNGVKDTLEFRNGKAYYVQRVKKYTLVSGDIDSIETSLTNLDSVYISKKTDAIDYGVSNIEDAFTLSGYNTVGAIADDVSFVNTISSLYHPVFYRLFILKGTYATLAEAQADLVGTVIYYQIATPIETEIATIGNAIAYPNGTVYVDDVTIAMAQYTGKAEVENTDYPIEALDEIYLLNADGSKTKLDNAGATIAVDGLSFTHTGLASGDMVTFSYFYQGVNIKGLTTVYYYDDKMIVAGSGTTAGKVYKIVPTVVDENIVWTKVEV